MERHQTILKKTEKVWKNLGVHYAEIFEYTEDKKKSTIGEYWNCSFEFNPKLKMPKLYKLFKKEGWIILYTWLLWQQKDKEKLQKELRVHQHDTNKNVHVPLKNLRKEIKEFGSLYTYIICMHIGTTTYIYTTNLKTYIQCNYIWQNLRKGIKEFGSLYTYITTTYM